MSIITVKLLLIPDKTQRQRFYDFSYYADKMYNIALRWNIDYYNSEGMFYSRYDMISMLPEFKDDNTDFAVINDYVLRTALTDLRTALDNMRKTGSGFPRFKRYGRHNSFGVRGDRLKVFSNKVRIPSVGIVKCKHCHYITRDLTDEQLRQLKYHNPHIIYDGKYWFLTFGVDIDTVRVETTDNIIGIDLGIKNTMYTSDNEVVSNINNIRQVINLEKRKKRLQRKLSRKYEINKQGRKFIKTKNIKRLERRIRLIDRRLRNIRENYNQSITNKIINRLPKRVMLEDLNIRGMLRNRHLSKSIQQQQFYHIRQLLIEKALNTQAVRVGVVSRFYPSSKRCSNCGNIKNNLRLSDRIYKCDNCGLEIDRDYNASINIRDCEEYEIVAN